MFLSQYPQLRPVLRIDRHQERNPRPSQLFASYEYFGGAVGGTGDGLNHASVVSDPSSYSPPPPMRMPMPMPATTTGTVALSGSGTSSNRRTNPASQPASVPQGLGGARSTMQPQQFDMRTVPKMTHFLPADLKPLEADHALATVMISGRAEEGGGCTGDAGTGNRVSHIDRRNNNNNGGSNSGRPPSHKSSAQHRHHRRSVPSPRSSASISSLLPPQQQQQQQQQRPRISSPARFFPLDTSPHHHLIAALANSKAQPQQQEHTHTNNAEDGHAIVVSTSPPNDSLAPHESAPATPMPTHGGSSDGSVVGPTEAPHSSAAAAASSASMPETVMTAPSSSIIDGTTSTSDPQQQELTVLASA